MFDFFKKKSYTVTQENGMEKLITAADMKKDAEEALKALEALPDNYIKDLIEYTKSSIEHGNISKEFLKMIQKIVDAVSTKKAKEVQKSLDDEAPAPKPKEEKKEEPKKEEPKKDNIIDFGGNLDKDIKEGDLGKAANSANDSLVRVAVDTNPASSKYRAEGIKEKLLEINKEVAVKSDNKVQNIGNNTKGIITPGDKSTVVKVKEETVRPDTVVNNVKIKIIRDEGEFEKLFPEKNIKFPTGDKVVLKASNQNADTSTTNNSTNIPKVTFTESTTADQKKLEEAGNILNDPNTSKEQKVEELKSKGYVESSIYDQVMNTVFNRNAEDKNIENSDESLEQFKEKVQHNMDVINQELA